LEQKANSFFLYSVFGFVDEKSFAETGLAEDDECGEPGRVLLLL
jgi:hypothetical protein